MIESKKHSGTVIEKNSYADSNGYVALPNVNIIEEMVDIISAARAYEANVAASKATMSMEMKTLEFLK